MHYTHEDLKVVVQGERTTFALALEVGRTRVSHVGEISRLDKQTRLENKFEIGLSKSFLDDS